MTTIPDPSSIPQFLMEATPDARAALAAWETAKSAHVEARRALSEANTLRRGKIQWRGSLGDPHRVTVPAHGVTTAEFDDFESKIAKAEKTEDDARRIAKRAVENVHQLVGAIPAEQRTQLAIDETVAAHEQTMAALAELEKAIQRRTVAYGVPGVAGLGLQNDEVYSAVMASSEASSPLQMLAFHIRTFDSSLSTLLWRREQATKEAAA